MWASDGGIRSYLVAVGDRREPVDGHEILETLTLIAELIGWAVSTVAGGPRKTTFSLPAMKSRVPR